MVGSVFLCRIRIVGADAAYAVAKRKRDGDEGNLEKQPLRDVFATQGVLAVLTGILILGLNLTAPEFCAELLTQWQDIFEESLSIESIGQKLLQWWSAVWSL